jgi:biopolymer transport protein ExbD
MLIQDKNNIILIITLFCFSILLLSGCSEKKESERDQKIVVTISVKDAVFVNGEKVDVDSLAVRLHELSVGKNTNIILAPDPEAGPGTIEKVQRAIRLYKYVPDQDN